MDLDAGTPDYLDGGPVARTAWQWMQRPKETGRNESTAEQPRENVMRQP